MKIVIVQLTPDRKSIEVVNAIGCKVSEKYINQMEIYFEGLEVGYTPLANIIHIYSEL